MRKKLRLPVEPYILPWVGVFLLILLLVMLCAGGGGKKKNAPQTAAGVAWIAEQELKDPAEVERTVRKREIEKLRLQAQSDRDAARANLLDVADDAVWGRFRDYVVLGDSRAVGFYYYHFLDRSRVFADGGHTIRNIPDFIDEIKMLNPAYIYLCYGLNDTGVGYWKTGEQYGAELDERITQLQAAVPGVIVVVNSILPATEKAVSANPVWKKIPEFSEAAEAVCKEKGVVFVDNADIAEACMDTLWDEDGIRLLPEFYPYWARNMLIAAMEAEY